MRPYCRELVLFLLCLAALGGPTLPGAGAGRQIQSKQERSVVQHLRKLEHKSASVVNFWRHKGHWALFTRHQKCWQVNGEAQRRVCRMARRSLMAHKHRLTNVRRRLEQVLPPHDTGYLPPAQARKLGQRMAALYYGWRGEEWVCLDTIWGTRQGLLESGWYVRADNPTSDAYGIPQALPGSKMASAGANWVKSAFVQIKWGLGYIKGRYHTPCGALAFRLANGWY